MALSSIALLTTEEALTFLQLPSVTQADKEYVVVEMLVNGASGALDKRCGPIIERQFTERYDGGAKSQIFLRNYPVAEVTTVTVDGETWPPVEYGFYDYGVVYVRDGTFRVVRFFADDDRQNVVISYKAGLAADRAAVPEDLRQACMLLVSHWYRREVEVVGATYDAAQPDPGGPDFPSAVKFLLRPYERRNRAGGV